MKKTIIVVLMHGLTIFATQLAFADSNALKTIQMSTILKNLQANGYNTIQKIEFNDGVYKAKALSLLGKNVTVTINPQTGEVISPTLNPANVSALIAAQKVEAAGYHAIYKMEAETNGYEVRALDKNSKQVKLEVDAKTGQISKAWF